MESLLIIGVPVGLFAWWMYTIRRNERSNNDQLGVDATDAHRALGLIYLGGYPGFEDPVTCDLVITPTEVAVEKGARILFRLPIADVHEIVVETEEEAKRRLTATRMLAVGVFALAFPKKTAGSVLITIDARTAPLVFEAQRQSKPHMLRQLAPAIAIVTQSGAGPRPSPAAQPASVADELRKLGELRDSGVLSDEEFEAQKRRLID